MQLQLKRLFAIDTFSLLLFAIVILGVVDHLPSITNIMIQGLYAAITLLLTVHFLRCRLMGMAILKISMLLILYALDIYAFTF